MLRAYVLPDCLCVTFTLIILLARRISRRGLSPVLCPLPPVPFPLFPVWPFSRPPRPLSPVPGVSPVYPRLLPRVPRPLSLVPCPLCPVCPRRLRGDSDLEVEEWLWTLQEQAEASGGAVYHLLGNHEVRRYGIYDAKRSLRW